MHVNVHEAKTQFSKLLELVENGEIVTIARHGKPVANLVPAPKKLGGFPLGSGRHDPPLVPPGDEWWQPMTEDEIKVWTDGE